MWQYKAGAEIFSSPALAFITQEDCCSQEKDKRDTEENDSVPFVQENTNINRNESIMDGNGCKSTQGITQEKKSRIDGNVPNAHIVHQQPVIIFGSQNNITNEHYVHCVDSHGHMLWKYALPSRVYSTCFYFELQENSSQKQDSDDFIQGQQQDSSEDQKQDSSEQKQDSSEELKPDNKQDEQEQDSKEQQHDREGQKQESLQLLSSERKTLENYDSNRIGYEAEGSIDLIHLDSLEHFEQRESGGGIADMNESKQDVGLIRVERNCKTMKHNVTLGGSERTNSLKQKTTEQDITSKTVNETKGNNQINQNLNTDLSKQTKAFVVVCTTDGKLFILDACTGALCMQYSFPYEVFSSPVVWNERIVVGCRDDFVYGLFVECSTDMKLQNM